MHKGSKCFFLALVFIFLPSLAVSFSTKNGLIYDNNGKIYHIDGVAWMGFQSSNFLGGLWDTAFNPIGTDKGVVPLMTAPWDVPGSNITSPKAGFAVKTVRLPIQGGIWHDITSLSPYPFKFKLTSKDAPMAGNGPFCDWSAGTDSSGRCIKPLGAAALLNATISQLGQHNINVMLDFHNRPGFGSGFRDGTVVAANYSLKTYYQDIATFAKTAPSNIMGFDLYNEPYQLYWFKANTSVSPAQPAWINVIAAAAAALYDNNQSLLVIAEAPGSDTLPGNEPYDPVYSTTTPLCMKAGTTVVNTSRIAIRKSSLCTNPAAPLKASYITSNWGENFRPLLDTAQSINGIPAFNVKFFRSMLIKAIQENNFSSESPDAIADWLLGKNNDGNGGHLVFAPHLYGPKAATGTAWDVGDSTIRFDWNFGFLFDAGFPVVIGEHGFDEPGGEGFFLNSIAPYFIKKGINHNLFFWTWNHDDAPIGLRGSDSNYTLIAYKEQDLADFFNATPPSARTGRICVTVPQPSGYTGTKMPVITATGPASYSFNLSSFGIPVCQNEVIAGSYTFAGSSLINMDNVTYIPTESPVVGVAEGKQTDVSMNYVRDSVGSLQINVIGETNCPVPSSQLSTIHYKSASMAGDVVVSGTTPVSISLPANNYTLSVTPETLPGAPECNVSSSGYPVSILSGQTSKAVIQYVYTPPVSGCTITARCSTWGKPDDSWAGSSCNLKINLNATLSNPVVFNMKAAGMHALTGVWNATGSLQNTQLTLTLSSVNVLSFGFNAGGLVVLPANATVKTNGVTYICTIK